MKCISLWQPWATLIAILAKGNETRSWSTPYRGPLLIHAAKTDQGKDISYTSPFPEALSAAGYRRFSQLPLGEIVALVELLDVVRTENIRDSLSEQERAFGDYSDGRYAWKLGKVRRVENAPLRGMQGLFDAEMPVGSRVWAEEYLPEVAPIEPELIQGRLF